MTQIREDGSLAHGNSPRELQILIRTDAGIDTASVAAELGLSPAYVHQVKTMYSGSWVANDAFDRMVAIGSLRLLAAIVATGRCYS